MAITLSQSSTGTPGLIAIDALGLSGEYRTRNRETITDTAGVAVAELSIVPPLYVTRTITAQRTVRPLPAALREAALAKTAGVFVNSVIGGLDFDRYVELASRVSGLPVGVTRAGARGGWQAKLRVCLYSGLLILPGSLLMNSPHFSVVLTGVPLYFALSGIVTAVGFSAILDAVPNRSRGLAMSMSFFLNVAIGAGIGPTAVALAGEHVFGARQGLGPPLVLTVAGGYLVALVALWVASSFRGPVPRAGDRASKPG